MYNYWKKLFYHKELPMKFIKFTSIVLLALSLGTVSCSDGEDGAQGPQGISGEIGDTGQQGEVGENGADGANAAGYDELTQYGYITMNVSGTRPDGVAFEDTATFKYTPTIAGYSTMYSGDSFYFDTTRFLSVPEDWYQGSEIYISIFSSNNPDEETIEIDGIETFDLEGYAVVGEDNKYFILDISSVDLPAEAIENFTFDPADRNHATYSYSIAIPAVNNSSGHELQVSGEVDVYLLEEL
jgi:hypothetical protein